MVNTSLLVTVLHSEHSVPETLEIAETGLCRGIEGTVEAIRYVNRHVGSSQFLKCLGIQNEKESSFILLRKLGGVNINSSM